MLRFNIWILHMKDLGLYETQIIIFTLRSFKNSTFRRSHFYIEELACPLKKIF